MAKAFEEYGAFIMRDPRVKEEDNERFLDMMEKYFELPEAVKLKDARPEAAYQIGATPEYTEEPRCVKDANCWERIKQYDNNNMPHKPIGPDPKWRFFWRIGERPEKTNFQEFNAKDITPQGFPEWEQVMNQWGNLMLKAVTMVAEMTAIGFGMEKTILSQLGINGPHLLAPTGTDLNRFHKISTIFAGFHYDINFITIHGRSRFPGLSIWTKNGRRIEVKVPEGCLLVQAGHEMQYITGGRVEAGYHEVIFTEAVEKVLEQARQEHRSCWRVSSTFFYHIASDCVIEPLFPFRNEGSLKEYPPITAGELLNRELSTIGLKY